MAKEKKEKISLTGYNPVETPEEIIASDKDTNRREAFQKAYKVIANIIPGYFLEQRKKKNATSGGGGTAFTQSIVVTPEKVTLETKENAKTEEKQEERERED